MAKLNGTLPRAYLVRSSRACLKPTADAVAAGFAPDFDPFYEVLLEPQLPPGKHDILADTSDDWHARCLKTQLGDQEKKRGIVPVEPTIYRHATVPFDFVTETPAWLVLLDRNAPG